MRCLVVLRPMNLKSVGHNYGLYIEVFAFYGSALLNNNTLAYRTKGHYPIISEKEH